MGIIGRKIREIKDLYREQEEICDEIRKVSKDKPLLIIKDTWSKPQSGTGFNYKGRACVVQDVYIQRGEVWIKPKMIDKRTKKFTVESRNYYRESHFREITSYKDLMKLEGDYTYSN